MTPQKIVGVIFSRADLGRALRMRKPPDLFEVRLDRLPGMALPRLSAPIIITARESREGGANKLTPAQRRTVLLKFLPRAAYVDIELRSARALDSVLQSATEQRVSSIISFHDFETTPPVARLDEIASRARSLGAAIVKVAIRTDTTAQFDRLLDFWEHQRPVGNVVAMGIGKLGRASRLELARRGNILNYVHLGSPAAAGQLSIRDLRRMASHR
jgi:3-dehydroquinate dehydratase-1